MHRPDLTSHNLLVWSNEPVIIRSPYVLKLRETISAVWPWKTHVNQGGNENTYWVTGWTLRNLSEATRRDLLLATAFDLTFFPFTGLVAGGE